MATKAKKIKKIILDDSAAIQLKQAALDTKPVSGLTHDFYRYPARFSPNFVRHVIQLFTKPGDLILDPFVGGGTTVVEARALGRRAVGIDINGLATFVSKTKTTLLSKTDTEEIMRWLNKLPKELNLHIRSTTDDEWFDYYRNIVCKQTWPIQKSIQLAISSLRKLPSPKQQNFARCALLKTAQWALDSRKKIPSASEFRSKYLLDTEHMLDSIIEYSSIVRSADKLWDTNGLRRLKILNRTAVGIERDERLSSLPKPRIILTSPPYPGVHVLYHRWQVRGRRETPAPYWIANKLDGSGASYYTFGDRQEDELTSYYKNTYQSFASLAKLSGRRTILVQMVAFSEPDWQLPLYLDVLQEAGFQEHKIPALANSRDGRLWRRVPNRKWFADYQGQTSASREAVLFHRSK